MKALFNTGLLIVCMILSPCIRADNKQPIEKVYPIGSTTYLFTLSVWSDSPPESGEIHAASKKSIRAAMELVRKQEERERLREKSDPSQPIDEPHVPTPDLYVYQYTVSIWSDGSIETVNLQRSTMLSLEQALNRLIAAEEQQKDSHRKEITTASTPISFRAGPTTIGERQTRVQVQQPWMDGDNDSKAYKWQEQCHAATNSGSRCARKSKELSGRCWQHADRPDSFPNAE